MPKSHPSQKNNKPFFAIMAIIVCRIVEVCVFRFVNDRPQFLMLKRSPGEQLYPNIWQFVTGSIVDGEKAYDAALR